MNALDIVIIAAVGLAFIFAIRSSVKNAKRAVTVALRQVPAPLRIRAVSVRSLKPWFQTSRMH